ncbi:MAG: 50S ribosomal protein L30 [Coriobacteriia bacterium]
MAKKPAEKQLKVTQIKSGIGFPADQKRTVRALGLKRMNDSVVQSASPAVLGMIFKVKHLVKVEEL